MALLDGSHELSDTSTATPIVVNPDPSQEQLQSAIRSVILGFGSFAAALGFTKVAGGLDLLLQIVGPIAMLVSIVMSQLNTRASHAQKVTMAQATPNAVAVVKS